MNSIPDIRIRTLGDAEINGDADFVLYWMVANRRALWNFSLQRAVDWARDLGKPLVVFEALRVGYRWASDRIHWFVIQGMADNARRLKDRAACYYPYLERKSGDGKGLLAELARRAAVVVSDDFPCFFLPRMLQAARSQIPVRFELIDSNGLLPMRAASKVFARAYDFRRFLQKTLPDHYENLPYADPLNGARLPKLEKLPTTITRKWPAANVVEMAKSANCLREFPIDHDVEISPIDGGSQAAETRLRDFLDNKLDDYEDRNQPDRDLASGLSPFLHFGHISAHQVFAETIEKDGWMPDAVADKATGSSSGWWGTSEPVESFLDELITWRELGYNFCWQRDDYDQYDSLPEWAKQTLADHESDKREYVYDLQQFESAETHGRIVERSPAATCSRRTAAQLFADAMG